MSSPLSEAARPPCVALVLDSPLAVRVLSAACQAEGAEPVVYDSGDAALLDTLAATVPRLVVLRRTLVYADGAEVCARIRADPRLRSVQIILASTDAEYARAAVRAGAHAHLLLPCRAPEARAAIRAQLEPQPIVLIVDDSRTQRHLMAPALRADGWRVVEAEDGLEALERLEDFGGIRLVITDIEMPRMDGWALCTAVKSQPHTAHLPVILVTSLDSADAIARGFAAGATDYLTKPVVLTELVTRARRMLVTGENMRGEQVLVADADPIRRGTLAQILVTHGFEAVAVACMNDAAVALGQRAVHLVVGDVDLDGESGVELARRLRSQEAYVDVPFLLVTDRTGRVESVRAASAGVQSVVVRPYLPERVLAEVERVLMEARMVRQRRALRRYLSGEALAAVEQYVDGGASSAPRAAQRHRTILFADLAGFTRLCEHRSAAEVVDILNHFFDATVPVLVRHGASIDKLIGDCILAVYDGGPAGALGAVAGAVEVMQEIMPKLRSELGLDLGLCVGINSGLVTVGDIGSRDFRRDYTVIGDVVNVAQRLQSDAEVNQILLGDATRELLGDAVPLGTGQVLTVRGRAAGVPAWPVRLKEE